MLQVHHNHKPTVLARRIEPQLVCLMSERKFHCRSNVGSLEKLARTLASQTAIRTSLCSLAHAAILKQNNFSSINSKKVDAQHLLPRDMYLENMLHFHHLVSSRRTTTTDSKQQDEKTVFSSHQIADRSSRDRTDHLTVVHRSSNSEKLICSLNEDITTCDST